jgi:glycosyltransferase involved in cell wall biosynthesis
MEAMACGTPVVSTRCGGPEQFLVEGWNGHLVDSDPQAMASAIAAIASHRPRRERLAAAARQWVAENASLAAAREIFRTNLRATWPDLAIPEPEIP